MIQAVVTISSTRGFLNLTVNGHAESAREGHDLVCAGISAIVLGGVSALKDGDSCYAFEDKKGHVKLTRVTEGISVHDSTVIETVLAQIGSVASSYPKNVTLERKIEP